MSARPDSVFKPAAIGADIRPAARSAVEALATRIQEHIAAEGLGVGDSLPSERELCEQFATSRNTVREAMRMLKAYGIVDVRPKVGATIIDNRMARAFDLFSFNTLEVSRETFADIQEFRSLIEVASVDRIFGRVGAHDIVDLRNINEGLQNPQAIPQASEIDFQFHVRLVQILDNAAMRDVYRIMKPVIIRVMEKGKTCRTFQTQTYVEHTSVIDALESRNRIRYQYALQSHLDSGFANFREAMEAGR